MKNDIESNPIARAIMAARSTRQWFLKSGDLHVFSHSWPRGPDKLSALKSAFGIDAPATAADQDRNWNPASDFVQKMVAEGEWLSRAQYLRLRRDIDTWAGMVIQARPVHVLEIEWSPIGYGPARVPATNRFSIAVRVTWYPDGAVVLEAEDVMEASDEIASLYVFMGCRHEHKGVSQGYRGTYHVHTCTKCGHRYEIDSGD